MVVVVVVVFVKAGAINEIQVTTIVLINTVFAGQHCSCCLRPQVDTIYACGSCAFAFLKVLSSGSVVNLRGPQGGLHKMGATIRFIFIFTFVG